MQCIPRTAVCRNSACGHSSPSGSGRRSNKITTYFIDFGEDYEVGVCEPVYGTDDETAYDNSYVLTGHEEYSFGDVQMGHT